MRESELLNRVLIFTTKKERMSANLSIKPPKNTLNIAQIHLSEGNRKKLNQLLEEFTYSEALRKFNLPIDNKILLHGATGCGKTATANAIAKHLDKDIIILNLGNFVSSRLGETAKNITEIFRKAYLERAVLFIDEFDFIGKERDYDEKDSGEMKRLVNALIQQIDNLKEEVLLICATNHIQVIDSALLRRFQLKLSYEMPTQEQLDRYYDDLLSDFPENLTQFNRKYGISYAETKDFVYHEIKTKVIELEKQKK